MDKQQITGMILAAIFLAFGYGAGRLHQFLVHLINAANDDE